MTPEWSFNKTAVCAERSGTPLGAGKLCCRAAAGSLVFTNDTFLLLHVNAVLHLLAIEPQHAVLVISILTEL